MVNKLPNPTHGPRVLFLKAGEPSEAAVRILEVAERLFAEKGIEAVTTHSIVTAAGQKNRAAVLYHFGKLPDLLASLINRRLRHVNALRHIHLDAMEARGRGDDVRGIVTAIVQALTDTVRETPWGRYYVQVLAQTTFSPSLMTSDVVEPANLGGILRARRLLQAALADLPRPVLDQRIVWMSDNVVYSVARWVREEGPALREPGMVDDLVDYCVNGLQAPVTHADSKRKVAPRSKRTGMARYFT
ncbi:MULTISPECIES: TetR/AcrR family transcriptional regulator [unclassified Variovorax]|uniref:TetR/AcrR family transcriptional regulator n=1 Tax=unclassified Variovorax TaxID=663243 RepID=UPI001BD4FF00|nr:MULTISPECIES: TetR/AcrR family transcriptional regulator [unclassified Variovorax]